MRGKFAIVVILALAIAAGGFAWWWNYQRSARARAFWGPAATTIRFAEKVEAFKVELPDDRAYLHPMPGGDYDFAGEPVDMTGKPGLSNAIYSIMADDGFEWWIEPYKPKPSNQWRLGVRFRKDQDTLTLLFSNSSDEMLVLERGEAVVLDHKTAAGWKDYLERNLKTGDQDSRGPNDAG